MTGQNYRKIIELEFVWFLKLTLYIHIYTCIQKTNSNTVFWDILALVNNWPYSPPLRKGEK